MDVVFLGEFRGERAFEGVEVVLDEVQEVGGGGVAEEEGLAGVFGCLGCFVVEMAFCSRVFGFDLADG